MTMSFRYRLHSRQTPSVPLGGRWTQPRPIIPVTLIGTQGTLLTEGTLDSGADETLFPESSARLIGIDLATAVAGAGATVGGLVLPVRYALVTFRIADSQERREWQGWVAFTPTRIARPLLGFGGFLQYFTATFYNDREVVDLTINSLYSGT